MKPRFLLLLFALSLSIGLSGKTYNAYDRPATISQDYKTATFTYNSSHERVKMHVARPDGDLTRYYVGGRYEIESDADLGLTKELLYLGGDAYSAPMVLLNISGSGWTKYVIGRDYLGSITNIAETSGTSVERHNFDAWGGGTPSYTLRRGWCGHEHLTEFGLINMNARLYDPVLGRFLSPDPYIQTPDNPANFNRDAYCLNNPLKYSDESGEFAITTMLIVGGITAAIFGFGNLATHAIREDDLGHGKWAEYFFSGALAGFALGALGYAGISGMVSLASMSGFWGGLGKTVLWSTIGMATVNNYATVASIAGGAITHGLDGLASAGKIILGNFYLDENKSFWGQVGEGILRHTWEAPQQSLGYFWSSVRNSFGAVDRVDYLGGATFSTDEKHYGGGVSLGSYINYNPGITITGDFESFVKQYPGYMHEYGHYIDSQSFGLAYLFAIGAPSLVSAMRSGGPSSPEGFPISYHSYFWTETRANRNAARYFGRHYGVNWSSDIYSYFGKPRTIIDGYPL